MRNLQYGLLIGSSLVIVAMVALTGYLIWGLFAPVSTAETAPTVSAEITESPLATVMPPPLPATSTPFPTSTPTVEPLVDEPLVDEPLVDEPLIDEPAGEATAVFVTITPDPAQPPVEPESIPTAVIASVEGESISAEVIDNVTILGYSRQGRPIESYRFGNGPTNIIFVGGMHGGYEWNTIVLAYQAIDYFTVNAATIPANISLHIVPSANPDGQYLVTNKEGRFTAADILTDDTFPGRFNSIGVDLNRNWDCLWSEEAYWRDQRIDPGSGPFSEPESQALRNFILELLPRSVIFWHSAANGTFAAACPELFEPSLVLAELYGIDAGYPAYEAFSAYEITGDAGDWLSTIGIPSITVELRNRQETDWEQNLSGMQAILRFYNTGAVENDGN